MQINIHDVKRFTYWGHLQMSASKIVIQGLYPHLLSAW